MTVYINQETRILSWAWQLRWSTGKSTHLKDRLPGSSQCVFQPCGRHFAFRLLTCCFNNLTFPFNYYGPSRIVKLVEYHCTWLSSAHFVINVSGLATSVTISYSSRWLITLRPVRPRMVAQSVAQLQKNASLLKPYFAKPVNCLYSYNRIIYSLFKTLLFHGMHWNLWPHPWITRSRNPDST